MSISVSSRFVLSTAALACCLLAGNLTERRLPEELSAPLSEVPTRIEAWTTLRDHTLAESTVRALRPTSYLSRTYQKGPKHLDLFIAFYAEQRAGESMHSPKHCLPGAGWEIWQTGSARVVLGAEQFDINKYSIQNEGVRMLMFYWYQSKSRIVASEYLGKLLLAKDTLLSGHTAGSIVRVTLPDNAEAVDEGVAFSSSVVPELWRCLGRR